MSTPFVSVIIPVYNDPIRLKTCLQVLEEQTYPKNAYEVIVVDNNSDESIEPIVAGFSQAKTGYEFHPGSYAARNKGISLAKGEIIAFIDSDCLPAPDWIERGVVNLLRVSNCGIVGGKVELFFKNPDNPTSIELYDKIMHLNQKTYIEKYKFSATANLFTFKHVFEHVGCFDGNLKSSGDKEWGQRVASFGYTLVYADDVLVTHPARHVFKQLCQKVARLAGGFETLGNKRKSSVFQKLDWNILINFLPPVITVIRLGRAHQAVDMKKQITIILIWFIIKYIELKERLSIKLLRKFTR